VTKNIILKIYSTKICFSQNFFLY